MYESLINCLEHVGETYAVLYFCHVDGHAQPSASVLCMQHLFTQCWSAGFQRQLTPCYEQVRVLFETLLMCLKNYYS